MILFSKNLDNTFIYTFWDNQREIFTQKSYLPLLFHVLLNFLGIKWYSCKYASCSYSCELAITQDKKWEKHF